MRSLFPSTYDRADVLMSAGCSTFVSAALILVIPRVGIVLLEILLGLFFIGCALAARARLRIQARSQVKEGPEGSTNAKAKWFDRYDVLMILTVIVIYSSMSGLLRHAGLSEGTVGILPLILFAAGILLKPRAVQFIERRRKDRKEPKPTMGDRTWMPAKNRRSQERKRLSDASERTRNDCRFEAFSTRPERRKERAGSKER
jgi:hypothetical protein